MQVWLQQIKGSWRENSRVEKYTKKLSPEVIDLLDKVRCVSISRWGAGPTPHNTNTLLPLLWPGV